MAYGEYEPINDADGQPRLLGKGSYGKVLLVRKTKLGRQYALKLLTAELLEKKATARDRFLMEVETFAGLHHPNIVTIADYGECAEGIYYVMEYCEGGSLETHLRQRRALPVLLVLRLLEKTASALEYALGKNLVHRDIKPENLMLLSAAERDDDLPDRLRVIDFGLVKHVAAPQAPEAGVTETQLPNESQIVGTPLYMAPEQLRGADSDHRADIFSLGLTAWYLLAGNSAFAHLTHTGNIRQDRFSAIPYSSKLPNHLTGRAREVIARMIEKDPARRFQTYPALRQALRDAIAEETALTAPPSASPPPIPAGGGVPARAPEPAHTVPAGDSLHYTNLSPAGEDPATGGPRFNALCLDQPVILIRLPSSQSPALSRLLGRLDVPERPASLVPYYRHTFSPNHPDFPGECVCTTADLAGPDLLAVIRHRKRTTLEEAKSLLQQIAEAMDFARAREISLNFSPGTILLPGLSSPAAETPEFSAAGIRIFPSLAEGESKADQAATLGATMAGPSGGTGCGVPTLRDFTALVYQILAGREPDPGAFVSVRNYRGISSLQTKTDAIIRDTIANLRHPQSCRALLLNLCSSEGVRLPARLPSSATMGTGEFSFSGTQSFPAPSSSMAGTDTIRPPASIPLIPGAPPALPPGPGPGSAAGLSPLSPAMGHEAQPESDPLLESPEIWNDLPQTTKRRLQSCLRDIWQLRRDISQYHITALTYSTQIRSQSQTLSRNQPIVLKEIEEAARDIEACRRILHDCESQATEAIHAVRDTTDPEQAEIRKRVIFTLLAEAEHAHSDSIAHFQHQQGIPEKFEARLEEIHTASEAGRSLLSRLGPPLPALSSALTDPAVRQRHEEISGKLELIRRHGQATQILEQARHSDSLHAAETLLSQANSALAQALELEAPVLNAAAELRQQLQAFELEEKERAAAVAAARRTVSQALGQVDEHIHQASSNARRAADIAGPHPEAAGPAQRTAASLREIESFRTDIQAALTQIDSGPTAEAAEKAAARARKAAEKAAAAAEESAGALQIIERLTRPAAERLALARQSAQASLASARTALRQILALIEKAGGENQSLPEGDRDPATLAFLAAESDAAQRNAAQAEAAVLAANQSATPEDAETAVSDASRAAAAAAAIVHSVTARCEEYQSAVTKSRAAWNQLRLEFTNALAECRTIRQQAQEAGALLTGFAPPSSEDATSLHAINNLDGRLNALTQTFESAQSLSEAKPLAAEATQLAAQARTDAARLQTLVHQRREAAAEAERQKQTQQAAAQRLAREAEEAAAQASLFATRIDQLPAGTSRPAALVHVSEAQSAAARAKSLLSTPFSAAILPELEACTRQAREAAATLSSLAGPAPQPKPLKKFPLVPVAAAALVVLLGGGAAAWYFLLRPKSPVTPVVAQNPGTSTPPGPNPNPNPNPGPGPKPDPGQTKPPQPQPPAVKTPPAGQEWTVPGDFATVQAAIDAAGPGQPITLKAGKFDEHLVLKTGVRLTGAGGDRTTVSTDGLTFSALSGKDLQGVTIEGITFRHDGNNAAADGRPLIDLTDSKVAFQDCIIRGGVTDGLRVRGEGSEITAADCTFEGHGRNAVHITLGAKAAFRKTKFHNNGKHGLLVDLNQAYVQLEECRMEENGDCGLEVGNSGILKALQTVSTRNSFGGWFIHDSGAKATFDTCESSANKNGLIIEAAATAELRSCKLIGNEETAIIAKDPEWMELTQSTIEDSKIYGVAVLRETGSASRRVRLLGNTIRNNGMTGIEIKGTGVNAEIRDNKVSGHQFDVYFVDGSAGQVTDNTWGSKAGLGWTDDSKVEESGNTSTAAP